MGKWGPCALLVFSLIAATARAETEAPAAAPAEATDAPIVAPKISTAKKRSAGKKSSKPAASEKSIELPTALASQAAPVLTEEQRDFARAQELLTGGKESEATISFSDFLRRHPTSALSDDAQFAMGEILFRQRKYDEAAAEYQKVFRFGVNRSDRIPEAAFQVGECWFRLKRLADARIEWEALRRKFPNSDAASRALTSLAGVP